MKIFVPGRICLFGEHSDWAGGYRRINADIEKGYTLITGTNQGIYAEVEPHPTALVLSSTTEDGQKSGPYEIPMEANALLNEAQSGSYWSYAAGVAYQILTNYHVRGLVIDNYRTDLPIKKGLSSSGSISLLYAFTSFDKELSLSDPMLPFFFLMSRVTRPIVDSTAVITLSGFMVFTLFKVFVVNRAGHQYPGQCHPPAHDTLLQFVSINKSSAFDFF